MRVVIIYCIYFQSGCIVDASWPVSGPVDEVLIRSSQYLMDAAHEFRIRLRALLQPKKVII